MAIRPRAHIDMYWSGYGTNIVQKGFQHWKTGMESKELELVEKCLNALEKNLFGSAHKEVKAEVVEVKT